MKNSKWTVRFAHSAKADLGEIINYVAAMDGIDAARELLKKFKETKKSLRSMPERGHFPAEMKSLNVWDYREVHVYNYRMIYRVYGADKRVVIHAVFEGRRHLDELLQERLLRIFTG